MLKKAIPLAITAALVTGCMAPDGADGYGGSRYGMPSKQAVGTLGGAAAGGLLGSQFGGGTGKLAATGLGVFLGGLLGNNVGQSLDKADKLYAERAAQQAFATSQPMQWRGQGGDYGVVTPGPISYAPTGQACREYHHKAYIGGKPRQVYGQACQQPDGSWQALG
jgi:surface antigen